jgi:sulfur carrier protein
MRAHVNGVESELATQATVADVVSRYGKDAQGRGVAVAVNGEVVARDRWAITTISDGDRVEVLGAIGGG